MPTDEEIRKFKEMLCECADRGIRQMQFQQSLQQTEQQKKEGLIDKFKKSMWR